MDAVYHVPWANAKGMPRNQECRSGLRQIQGLSPGATGSLPANAPRTASGRIVLVPESGVRSQEDGVWERRGEGTGPFIDRAMGWGAGPFLHLILKALSSSKPRAKSANQEIGVPGGGLGSRISRLALSHTESWERASGVS